MPRRVAVLGLAVFLLLAGTLAACGGDSTPKAPDGIGGRNGLDPNLGGKGGIGAGWDTQTAGGIETAIAWAESFMVGGQNAAQGHLYSGYCLALVANAYGTPGAMTSAHPEGDSAWELAVTLHLKDPGDPGKAPRGALMFFDFTSTNFSYRLWGHVGISLGPNPPEKPARGTYADGTMLSARSSVVIDSHIKTDSFWGKYYRGWDWPPAWWGPLAKQAPDSVKTAQNNPPPIQGGGNTCQLQCTSPGNNGGCQVGCTNNTPPAPTHTPTPVPPQPQPQPTTPVPVPPQTWAETAGGVAHTWTNYTNAGGTQGQSVNAYQTVQIACRVQGFKVADGNTWWYRIAQSPWNNTFFVSADAFYNNGQTSGSLIGTPFVDLNVRYC